MPPASRAVVVLGMHRSGTSALARGVNALGVDLGSNFFDLKPDNPTGYWEDKALVAISQRVLEELRLKWDDTEPIGRERFLHHRIRLLRLAAVRYFGENFVPRPLWGFKDPRAIRLLPFWIDALRDSGAEDCYVLVIRHPRSVAASLFRRQQIPLQKAQRLWLAHNVPFLHELRGKTIVVVDYDLLVQRPRAELDRIARRLGMFLDAAALREMDRFTDEFLDERLRHNAFSPDDFDTESREGRLARDAYLLLRDVATDAKRPDAAFWSRWEEVAAALGAAEVLDGTA